MNEDSSKITPVSEAIPKTMMDSKQTQTDDKEVGGEMCRRCSVRVEDNENSFIVVREEVSTKFTSIMKETAKDSNSLMEHLFGLYNSLAPKVNLGRALPAKVVSEPQPSLSTQSQQGEEEDKEANYSTDEYEEPMPSPPHDDGDDEEEEKSEEKTMEEASSSHIEKPSEAEDGKDEEMPAEEARDDENTASASSEKTQAKSSKDESATSQQAESADLSEDTTVGTDDGQQGAGAVSRKTANSTGSSGMVRVKQEVPSEHGEEVEEEEYVEEAPPRKEVIRRHRRTASAILASEVKKELQPDTGNSSRRTLRARKPRAANAGTSSPQAGPSHEDTSLRRSRRKRKSTLVRRVVNYADFTEMPFGGATLSDYDNLAIRAALDDDDDEGTEDYSIEVNVDDNPAKDEDYVGEPEEEEPADSGSNYSDEEFKVKKSPPKRAIKIPGLGRKKGKIMYEYKKGQGLKCKLCEFKTMRIDKIEQHMKSHSGSAPVVPVPAPKPSVPAKKKAKTTSAAAAAAPAAPAKPTTHTCEECNRTFKTKSILTRHMFVHSNERPYPCDQCDSAFKFKDKLDRHKLIHNRLKEVKEPVTLEKVEKIVLKMEDTERVDGANDEADANNDETEAADTSVGETEERDEFGELKPKAEKRVHQCDKCDYSASWPSHLEEHKRRHTGEKCYKCDICSFATAWKKNLKDHRARHPEATPLDDIEVLNADGTKKSRPKSDPSVKKDYKCGFCDFEGTSTQELHKHRKTHVGEKIYKCEFCDFATAWRKNLRNHRLIHTGEKPYKCKICDFCTRDYHSLKRHNAVTHNSSKDYVCEICGAAFALNHSLREHRAVHTTDKPFKCLLCDARYKHRSGLRLHKITHTGLKPFVCELCGNGYKQKSHLRKHQLNLHSEPNKMYCCKQCDFKSATCYSYNSHMRKHKPRVGPPKVTKRRRTKTKMVKDFQPLVPAGAMEIPPPPHPQPQPQPSHPNPNDPHMRTYMSPHAHEAHMTVPVPQPQGPPPPPVAPPVAPPHPPPPHPPPPPHTQQAIFNQESDWYPRFTQYAVSQISCYRSPSGQGPPVPPWN